MMEIMGNATLLVFLLVLVATVLVGLAATRVKDEGREGYLLAGRTLGPVAIGISAGATANSGFITLGAVGLGYAHGLTWAFLPLAWGLGDLVFWALFPERMNRVAREAGAATIPELLAPRGSPGWRTVRLAVGALLFCVVSTYGAAQALAGSKTMRVLFDVEAVTGAALTLALVGCYCLWGGLRASIWTDLLQGVVMVLLTGWALVSVGRRLLAGAAPGIEVEAHLSAFAGLSVVMVAGFILSWATAGIGFGLSQPQIVVRYFAGRDENTVRKAKWIYIAFVQFTWLGMTLFGVLARAVLPDLADAEVALLVYSRSVCSDLGVGLVLAGVFAAIASTLDSCVLAVGSIVSCDLVPALRGAAVSEGRLFHAIGATVALAVMFVVSAASSMSVFQLSVLPVELVAASVGPVMAVHLLWGRPSALQTLVGLALGVSGVWWWRHTGLEPIVSSALFGFVPFVVLGIWMLGTRRSRGRRSAKRSLR